MNFAARAVLGGRTVSSTRTLYGGQCVEGDAAKQKHVNYLDREWW